MVGNGNALSADDVRAAAFLTGRAFVVHVDFAFVYEGKGVVYAVAIPVVGPAGFYYGFAQSRPGSMGGIGVGDCDGARVAALNDCAVCLMVEIVFVFPDEDVRGAV